jgi:hypothetical protein
MGAYGNVSPEGVALGYDGGGLSGRRCLTSHLPGSGFSREEVYARILEAQRTQAPSPLNGERVGVRGESGKKSPPPR